MPNPENAQQCPENAMFGSRPGIAFLFALPVRQAGVAAALERSQQNGSQGRDGRTLVTGDFSTR
jgi:hypothetical protein